MGAHSFFLLGLVSLLAIIMYTGSTSPPRGGIAPPKFGRNSRQPPSGMRKPNRGQSNRTPKMGRPGNTGPNYGHLNGSNMFNNLLQAIGSKLFKNFVKKNQRMPDMGFLKKIKQASNSNNNFMQNLMQVMSQWMECKNNTCQNDGTCVEVGFKHCFCKPGFSGDACENHDDPSVCAQFRCKRACKFGYHSDENGCQLCKCLPTPCKRNKCRSGQKCHIRRPDCEKEPCPPAEGVCVDETHCAFKTGFCDKKCTYGFKLLKNGCADPKCICADDPCQAMTKSCPGGTECRAQKMMCDSDEDECYLDEYVAICRSVSKPGTCPMEDVTSQLTSQKGAGRAMSFLRSMVGDTKGGSDYDNILSTMKQTFMPMLSSMGLNVFGSGTECEETCATDADCQMLEKCCFSGCGSDCMQPSTAGDSICLMEKETHLMANNTAYTPNCTKEGLFAPVQCFHGYDNHAHCFCVDTETGKPIRGDVITDKVNINCSEVADSRICPELKCKAKDCEFGYEKDEWECNTCECAQNPCEDDEDSCPYGTVCELLKESCETPPCAVVRVCVDPSWSNATCKNGEALRDSMTRRLVTCDTDKPEEKKCPGSYYCSRDKEHDVSVCCPTGKHGDDKPGSCPPPRRPYGYHYRHNTPICTTMCKHDNDCGAELKCCEHSCGTECKLPTVNMSAPCQTAVEDAIIRLKLNPTDPVFIPRCLYNGTFQEIQCHDVFGLCWCAKPDGTRIPGTQIRGTPDCSKPGRAADDDKPICAAGEPLQRCRMSTCFHTKCPAHPSAVCRINPCGKCRAEFFDRGNRVVECHTDITKCLSIRKRNMANMFSSMFLDTPDYQIESMIDRLGQIRSGKRGKRRDWGQRRRGSSYHSHLRGRRSFSGEASDDDVIDVDDVIDADVDTLHRSKRGMPPSDRSGNFHHMASKYRAAFKKNGISDLFCPRSYQLRRTLKGKDACTEQCGSEEDCGAGMVCCSTGCGHVCIMPNVQEEKCFQPIDEGEDCKGGYMDEMDSVKRTQYHYNQEAKQCLPFTPNNCGGNENKFLEEADCENACEEVPSFNSPYIPTCSSAVYTTTIEHYFSPVQCAGKMCWCSDRDGTPKPGSLTKGPVSCVNGQVGRGESVQALCPDESIPKICTEECATKKCNPSSRSTEDGEFYGMTDVNCRADPCNDCKVTFMDTISNEEVECSDLAICEQPSDSGHCQDQPEARWYYDKEEQVCKTFTYSGCGGNANNFDDEKRCKMTCGGTLCPDGESPSLCPDVCASATCDRFPEALCVIDPCTCKPSWQDVETGRDVHCDQAMTLCQRMRRESLRSRMLVSEHADSIFLPVCDEDGTFHPLQCDDKHMLCWCVTDRGEQLPGTKVILDQKFTGTPPICLKQKTVEVDLVFRFPDDFSSIEKMKSAFEESLRKQISKTVDLPAQYVEVKVSAGSIIVNCKLLQYSSGDLESMVEYLFENIAEGSFVVSFSGMKFTADQNFTAHSVTDLDRASQQKNTDASQGVVTASRGKHHHVKHQQSTQPSAVRNTQIEEEDPLAKAVVALSVVSGIVGVALLVGVVLVVLRLRGIIFTETTTDTGNLAFSNQTYQEVEHPTPGLVAASITAPKAQLPDTSPDGVNVVVNGTASKA